MRTIDNAIYTFTVVEDQYHLTNNSGTLLPARLVSLDKLGIETEIFSLDLTIGQLYEFSLIKDTRYKLIISNQPYVYFTHFKSIRDYLITHLLELICDKCGCGCSEGTVNCLERKVRMKSKQLAISNIIQQYIRIPKDFSLIPDNPANTIVSTFLNNVYNLDYFKLQKEVANQLTSSVLKGSYEVNEYLYKYHLAMYYLGIYFEAKLEALSLIEREAVDTLYKLVHATPCLTSLGININTMSKEFNKTDTRVFFWQTAPTDTIANVIPLISKEYLLTKASYPLVDFTEGKKVPLISVGKLVFAVSPISNSNFTLYDSLGTDVTDDFDVYYDTITQTAVFVSQLTYSHSEMYFEFKPIS